MTRHSPASLPGAWVCLEQNGKCTLSFSIPPPASMAPSRVPSLGLQDTLNDRARNLPLRHWELSPARDPSQSRHPPRPPCPHSSAIPHPRSQGTSARPSPSSTRWGRRKLSRGRDSAGRSNSSQCSLSGSFPGQLPPTVLGAPHRPSSALNARAIPTWRWQGPRVQATSLLCVGVALRAPTWCCLELLPGAAVTGGPAVTLLWRVCRNGPALRDS